jgi:hypothetical protein
MLNRFFPLCESDDNHDILKKLIKYINSDINVNNEKEFKKLKNVLKMGCTDTLESFINENQTLNKPQPLIKPQPHVTTLPLSTIKYKPEFNKDRLNKKIEGLKHLNDVGEHKMTYYQFFENNNLLLDEYVDSYFKLTGIQNGYNNGNQHVNDKLYCIKVIKLVKKEGEGNFSLINKYDSHNDYRKIGQSLDKDPFNLHAKPVQGFQESYYDKINILTIETDKLIKLDNKNPSLPQLPPTPTYPPLPPPTPTPPPTAYTEGVSYYSQRAATEQEARRRAEQRARAWRTCYLLTIGAVLVLAGGERQSLVMVAAGVVLVVVAVLSAQEG